MMLVDIINIYIFYQDWNKYLYTAQFKPGGV